MLIDKRINRITNQASSKGKDFEDGDNSPVEGVAVAVATSGNSQVVEEEDSSAPLAEGRLFNQTTQQSVAVNARDRVIPISSVEHILRRNQATAFVTIKKEFVILVAVMTADQAEEVVRALPIRDALRSNAIIKIVALRRDNNNTLMQHTSQMKRFNSKISSNLVGQIIQATRQNSMLI